MMKQKKITFDIEVDELVKNYLILNDWRLYQLILFNVIQNAVKYNNRDGKV